MEKEILRGTSLFRAQLSPDMPVPRRCQDTLKKGVEILNITPWQL